jgi:3-deoxy-D-manno-octulosonic-acid transferase
VAWLPVFTHCCASVAEVAFIGNSLLEGCGGHNLAEAAVAGCAVLIGEHAGHFNTMADELNQAAVSCGYTCGICEGMWQCITVHTMLSTAAG